MRRQSSTQEYPGSHPSGSAGFSGARLGWTAGIFFASVALVLCVIVATAWVLGGRAAQTTLSVQELLPPQPREDAAAESQAQTETASGLQPPAGAEEMYTVGDTAAVLPGALDTSVVNEIPVESISALKSLGWAVPYLSRHGYEHQYAETTLFNGVRTIQSRLSDGEHYINVAETRAEEDDVELQPLGEKLYPVVDLDSVIAESLELPTGEDVSLYRAEDESLWTAAVDNPSVQYVITSDLPAEAAAEISSWVLVTDRSRVQILPSSPGPADRLEQGFDELRSLLER